MEILVRNLLEICRRFKMRFRISVRSKFCRQWSICLHGILHHKRILWISLRKHLFKPSVILNLILVKPLSSVVAQRRVLLFSHFLGIFLNKFLFTEHQTSLSFFSWHCTDRNTSLGIDFLPLIFDQTSHYLACKRIWFRSLTTYFNLMAHFGLLFSKTKFLL